MDAIERADAPGGGHQIGRPPGERLDGTIPPIEEMAKARHRNPQKFGQSEPCSMVVEDNDPGQSLPAHLPDKIPGPRNPLEERKRHGRISKIGPGDNLRSQRQGLCPLHDSRPNQEHWDPPFFLEFLDQGSTLDEVSKPSLLNDQNLPSHDHLRR